MLLGDLNGHVGDRVVEDVVGRYGIPGRYENGESMIQLCVDRKLIVGNTVPKEGYT